jgi:hypothetical protein
MHQAPLGSAAKPLPLLGAARRDLPTTIVLAALVLSILFLAWRVANVW